MFRSQIAVVAVALSLVAVSPVQAQSVKLKDLGVKGRLVSATCSPSTISCVLIDLSAVAPDEFFYVTQICMTQVTGTGMGYRVQTTSGLTYAQAGSPFNTECFSYEPALVVTANQTLSCIQQSSGAIGNCTVTGVLSAK